MDVSEILDFPASDDEDINFVGWIMDDAGGLFLLANMMRWIIHLRVD